MTPVKNILLLHTSPVLRRDANTISEHIASFARHSRFNIWNWNAELGFPDLGGLEFDIIIFHYSFFGIFSGDYETYVQRVNSFLQKIKPKYKIAFFQDEYYYCPKRFDFINRFQVDCIYTLIEPEYFKDTYERYTSARKIIHTIPGYVMDDLVQTANEMRLSYEERPYDIGYRARRLPYYNGKGAQEKTEIALTFKEKAAGYHLKLNVEVDEDKRIYGNDWNRFVAGCRGMLGVEAGVSVFDLEDKVRLKYEEMMRQNPDMTFDEFSESFLKDWEDNVYYRMISPRHFEAAAFKVCQILYEGKYSGILQPMKHYIPLKKDFSNLDEVIRLFQDQRVWEEITGQAYRDLIESGRYSYQKFIESFDQELMKEGFQPVHTSSDIEQVQQILLRNQRRKKLQYHIRYYRNRNFPGRALLVKYVKNPLMTLLKK